MSRIQQILIYFIILLSLHLNSVSTSYAEQDINDSLEKVLSTKSEVLTAQLTNTSILKAVKDANLSNATLSKDKIKELDDKWINTKGVDDFIKQYITNNCAKQLFKFQEDHDEFVEIFVTDKYGLNVCQTNKTSDLFQADEEWWQKTWSNGSGLTHHGKIEFDKSAHTEAIAIFIPIKDPASHEVLGIAKGVLDITQIKQAL